MKAMRELLENNIDIREIMRIKESPIVIVKNNKLCTGARHIAVRNSLIS